MITQKISVTQSMINPICHTFSIKICDMKMIPIEVTYITYYNMRMYFGQDIAN